MKKVVVFGGSGFIGGNLVVSLVEHKYCVKVYTRDKEKAARLKLHGNLGQVDIIEGKLSNFDLIEKLIVECDIIINLVGSINETSSAASEYLHQVFPHNIAKLADKHGKKFIHFSAMGADIASGSLYAKSKLAGEKKVQETCKNSVVIRPNLVFGADDSFFNKFARISRWSPVMPVFGKGRNLLQPVFVCDVVSFVIDDLILRKKFGGVHEICGPKTYTLKELFRQILKATGRKRLIVNIPFFVARKLAFLLEFKIVSFIFRPITGTLDPLITRDQLELMKYDITASGRGTSVKIGKTRLEEILPRYLEVYKKQA